MSILISTSERDWPEDFSHENGTYTNICHACKNTFLGYKRRVTCKICVAKIKSENRPPLTAEEIAGLWKEFEDKMNC